MRLCFSVLVRTALEVYLADDVRLCSAHWRLLDGLDVHPIDSNLCVCVSWCVS